GADHNAGALAGYRRVEVQAGCEPGCVRDELPPVHEVGLLISRCDRKIVPTEKRKMRVAMAFISGVAPRRRRDQISIGSVFSRPIRKNVTAISSIDRVKINNAAPSRQV